MSEHHISWYGNLNKLIKAVIVLSLPIAVLALIFWNVYPVTRVVTFSAIALISVGIMDRLLSWSLSGYNHRREQFFALLIGVVLGILLVSNDILPEIIIGVR